MIKPSGKNVKSLLREIRSVVKVNRASSAGELISQLNPKIRGWANYHRHVVSKETFNRVEGMIFRCIWQWAKRRHRNKGHRWIKEKYFCAIGERNWVFTGSKKGADGKPHPIHLLKAAATQIKRHIKIKGGANPYDREWDAYFEERIGKKMVETLKGRRKLLQVWRKRKGECPICKEKITGQSGWHSHHLIWRVKGGEERAENLILLHPECHRQLHSQKRDFQSCVQTKGVRKA